MQTPNKPVGCMYQNTGFQSEHRDVDSRALQQNVIRTTLRSPSNSRSGTLSHSPRATGVQL